MSAYGMKGHLGISFQNSFGTANVESFHYIPFISESFVETKPQLIDDSNYGRFDQEEAYEGLNEISGEVVFYPNADEIGIPLIAWLGDKTSPTSITNGQFYELMPEASDFDAKAATIPMTVEVYRDVGSSFQYYDMCCNQITIEVAAGEIVKVTMGMVGGNYSKMATTTPSFSSTAKSFLWDTTSLSIDGSGADDVTGLTITFNNNLEAVGVLNSTKLPGRIRRTGKRTIEVSGTILYENDTNLDIARSYDTIEMITTFTENTSNELEIIMPSFKFSEYPINIGGTGAIEISFAGACSYNVGSLTALDISLTNAITGY